MKHPSVAIVILNWNGKHLLEQFLPSVTNSTYPDKQVVVIDNASTDDSIAFLREQYPAIRLIRHHQNLGFAGGYNEGLKEVKADYFVLLNNDVEVLPGWIEPVIEFMEKAPLVAACQPKILQLSHRNYFEYAGASGGWIDLLGYPFARGRIFDHCEKDTGQYDTVSEVCWASGAALFIRPERFQKAGGFDAQFNAHMEEIDLCWRLQSDGYRICCCPSSVVYHLGGGSLPKGNPRKVFLNFRNNLLMLAKNLPLHWAILIIPARLILDIVAALKHIVTGEPAFFLAILHAQWAFIKWLFKKKTSYRFPVHKALPRNGLYRGSIVWQHFLRGATRFQEIVR